MNFADSESSDSCSEKIGGVTVSYKQLKENYLKYNHLDHIDER